LLARESVFCDQCWQRVSPVVSHEVFLSKYYTMKVFAASAYVDPVRKLIVRKFAGDMRAARQLGEVMVEKTLIRGGRFDIIVPVPLHWLRFARRGFNQAEVASSYVAQRLGVPALACVKRVRRTPYQSTVARLERLHNVQGAFSLLEGSAKALQGKHVLLIDDLYTSGATLSSVGKIVAHCKPASITALVAARVC
jgi:ComF family protein